MKINTDRFMESTLLLFLLCISSFALAFDPDAALKQEREKEIKAWLAENEKNDSANYDHHRNKAHAQLQDNGTVIVGRLQWMRCSLGQKLNSNMTSCTGRASKHNRKDSMTLPDLMNRQGGFAGFTDWRMPTFAELASLRACSSDRAYGLERLPEGRSTFRGCSGKYSSPTIDTRLFPDTSSSLYWTSSYTEGFNGYSALVSFGNGSPDSIYEGTTVKASVRLVRTNQ